MIRLPGFLRTLAARARACLRQVTGQPTPKQSSANQSPSPYLIVLLGADDESFVANTRREVRRAIEKRVRQLGLLPDQDVAFQDESSFDARMLENGMPVAAVYFGGHRHGEAATAAASALTEHGALVIPVVPDLDAFPSYVPEALRSINGDAPGGIGELPHRVASRLAESLGLLRRRRLAFISYKRTESSGVARQLHEALEARGFEVFLDTHSVEKGAEFQPVLWDRMADADVVLLLDTPGAFTSKWVEEEVSNAGMLGLAILQLVWPGHERTLGTSLCDVEYLVDSDFEDGVFGNKSARLSLARIGSLAAKIEDLRAQSFAARMLRLLGVAKRLLEPRGIDLVLQMDGSISAYADDGQSIGRIVPFVGHPDATHLHGAHTAYSCAESGSTCVLYDPASMLATKRSHLNWLNEFLPLRAVEPGELGPHLEQRPRTPL